MEITSSDPAVYYIRTVYVNGEYCRHSIQHIDTKSGITTLFTRDIDEIPDDAQNVKRVTQGYSYDLKGGVEIKVRDNTPLWARRALGLEPTAYIVT